MQKWFVAALWLGTLSGCVHRPSYREVVERAGGAAALTATELPEGQTLPVRIVDPQTREPLGGVGVRFGEGKGRVSLKSDIQGRLRWPLSKALLKENPLVEVNRASPGGYLLLADESTPPAPTNEATTPDAGT